MLAAHKPHVGPRCVHVAGCPEVLYHLFTIGPKFFRDANKCLAQSNLVKDTRSVPENLGHVKFA